MLNFLRVQRYLAEFSDIYIAVYIGTVVTHFATEDAEARSDIDTSE